MSFCSRLFQRNVGPRPKGHHSFDATTLVAKDPKFSATRGNLEIEATRPWAVAVAPRLSQPRNSLHRQRHRIPPSRSGSSPVRDRKKSEAESLIFREDRRACYRKSVRNQGITANNPATSG